MSPSSPTWKSHALGYLSEAFSDVIDPQRYSAFSTSTLAMREAPSPVMQALEAMAGISTGAVDKAREELQLEYARLFLTPGGLYPYESMYLGKEGHLMDEPYEQVRRFYLEQGTAVAPGQLHPEDHLAVELGFLAHLWSQDQVEAYYRFCRQHVLAWVPRCMEDLKAKTRSGWYQALADLVLAVLEIEAGTLLEVS